MGLSSQHLFPFLLVALTFYVTPVRAFGAGNIASISKIEGALLSFLLSPLSKRRTKID
jgi:hypothetical protein